MKDIVNTTCSHAGDSPQFGIVLVFALERAVEFPLPSGKYFFADATISFHPAKYGKKLRLIDYISYYRLLSVRINYKRI